MSAVFGNHTGFGDPWLTGATKSQISDISLIVLSEYKDLNGKIPKQGEPRSDFIVEESYQESLLKRSPSTYL